LPPSRSARIFKQDDWDEEFSGGEHRAINDWLATARRVQWFGLPTKMAIALYLACQKAGFVKAKTMFVDFGESRRRSLAKAVSWRCVASLDTFLISFIMTGKVTVAGSIAGTEVITKTAFYYFHERMWAFITWGSRR
jgi:uncharacterized membrane protein